MYNRTKAYFSHRHTDVNTNFKRITIYSEMFKTEVV